MANKLRHPPSDFYLLLIFSCAPEVAEMLQITRACNKHLLKASFLCLRQFPHTAKHGAASQFDFVLLLQAIKLKTSVFFTALFAWVQ